MSTIDDNTGRLEEAELALSPESSTELPRIVIVIVEGLRKITLIGRYGAEELWAVLDAEERKDVLDTKKPASEKSRYFIAAANRLRHSA